MQLFILQPHNLIASEAFPIKSLAVFKKIIFYPFHSAICIHHYIKVDRSTFHTHPIRKPADWKWIKT